MANTGYQAYTTLEQYYIETGLPTGATKPNIIGDPDYVSPVLNLIDCPLPTTTTTTTTTTSTTTSTTTIAPTTTSTTTSTTTLDCTLEGTADATPTPTTSTTTSTTTAGSIATITLSIVDVGGDCTFKAQVTSGTTADNISFDGDMKFYSAGGCSLVNLINTITYTSPNLYAPASVGTFIAQGTTYPTSTPVSANFVSPIVLAGPWGTTNVTLPNQQVTINGSIYTISALQNCFYI